MATIDAAELGQLAVRVNLLTKDQLRECQDEVGAQSKDPTPLVRALERKGYLTPWQTQKLLKGEKDGYFLGGYRLLYRISSGSFGRVFRADDPRTGNVVAIKVLRRRYTDNTHQVDLFEREGKVGLTMRDPGIVSILAVNRDSASKQYYIVMEFVEGGNLKDFLIIRKKLEPAEALRLLEDVVSGLSYAFSRGMTHRDIKPTNILISAQGQAKLVDFGLAGIYAGQSRDANDDQVDRTVDYAGLEKATGVKVGDVRSDIYFLGCVFYEMLTGRSPLVKTKDKQARMNQERFENIPPIQPDEVAGCKEVIGLVETMMSLNPQHRYQTPAQLLEAVREVRRQLEFEEPQSPPAPSQERAIFLVEKSKQLQTVMGGKFKELGYKVFLSPDPGQALIRYRHHPYDVLVMDAGSVGEEGINLFGQILQEADGQGQACVGILLLAQEQATWADKIPKTPLAVALVRPVTLKAVCQKISELAPV